MEFLGELMEFIGVIVFYVVLIGVVIGLIIEGLKFSASLVSRVISWVTGSGDKSVETEKSPSEILASLLKFEQRLVPGKMTEDRDSTDTIGIELRGGLPISRTVNLGFMVSIFDITEGGKQKPVISYLDFMQETDNHFFHQYIKIGICNPGSGISNWTQVGGFYPEMLQPPRSGLRKLKIVIRLVNADNPPATRGGLLKNKNGLLWSHSLNYQYKFTEKGYEEIAEHQEEAESITIKIGVAVAFSDGSMVNSEGEVIKNWIKRSLDAYSESRQKELKSTYNNAFKSAYEAHKAGTLSISALTDRLNKIGEKKTKFDAVDLTYEIMSADGVADPKELKMIRNLGESLELDMDEVEQIRSTHLINLKDAFSEDDALEQLLGIDKSWDTEKIKKHLASEFQRWNGRYNSLPKGAGKENAQNMLNSIGEARRKYDSR